MSENRREWIVKTAADMVEPFEDGFEWQDFVSLVPIAENKVILAIALGLIITGKRKKLVCDLLHEIIDITDTWGPDGIIDPVLKAVVSAFLVGNR